MTSKQLRSLLKIASFFQNIGKKLSESLWKKYVYSIWDRKAMQFTSNLCEIKKFTAEQKKEIDDYWFQHTGQFLPNTNSHLFYFCATGRFDVRFIPDALYFTRIDKYYNNWELARIIDNKTYYDALFPDVAQPKVVLKRVNGIWRTGGGGEILEESVNKRLLQLCPTFLKVANNSEGGKGVFYIDDSVYDENMIQTLLESIKGDIIVQEPIMQSAELSRLNPSSVNTIRCLTLLRTDGTAKLYSACLRMGIGNTKVDNASSGGCVVGIKPDGTLNEYAYTPNGKCFKTHPSSNIVFNDVVIPNFSLIKNLVLEQAKRFSYFRLVSWDVALDYKNEPVLIEANLCSGELDFHQLNNGPLFGEDTEDILEEVFKRD